MCGELSERLADEDRTEDDVVDVVLDPLLAVKMRAHQKDGVKVSSCIGGPLCS